MRLMTVGMRATVKERPPAEKRSARLSRPYLSEPSKKMWPVNLSTAPIGAYHTSALWLIPWNG